MTSKLMFAAIAAATLCAATAGAAAPDLYSYDRDTKDLVAIESDTGAVTVVGATGLARNLGLRALAEHQGVLYGLVIEAGDGERSLVTLNQATGAVETSVPIVLDDEFVYVDAIASDGTTLFAAYRSDLDNAFFCADAIALMDPVTGILTPFVIYPQFAPCDVGVDIDGLAANAGQFMGFNGLYYGEDHALNAVEVFAAQGHPGTYSVIFSPPEFDGAAFHSLSDMTWTSDGLYSIGALFPAGGPAELFQFDLSGVVAGVVTLTPDGNYGPIARRAVTCAADLDDDGTVGSSDLAILLSQWGACPGCSADLDGDGSVGPADLSVMLAAWGPC